MGLVTANAKSELLSSEICAVVTTFSPDSGVVDRIRAIRCQVGHLIVVDNGSDAHSVSCLEGLRAEPGFAIIPNPNNRGVGAALNQGIRAAKLSGFSWVLTMDQDSRVEPDLVKVLLDVYNSTDQKERIAVIGSAFWSNPEIPFHRTAVAPSFREVKMVITSGCLTSIAVMDRVGLFNEEFFIDHVDTEYCLRARSEGFIVLQSLTPAMTHAIGNATAHRLPWKTTQTSNHNPIRRYYNTRNMIRIVRRFWSTEPRWVAYVLISWIKTLILVALFEEERPAKLKQMCYGLRDGILEWK
jgi:rhamnosyltransferase